VCDVRTLILREAFRQEGPVRPPPPGLPSVTSCHCRCAAASSSSSAPGSLEWPSSADTTVFVAQPAEDSAREVRGQGPGPAERGRANGESLEPGERACSLPRRGERPSAGPPCSERTGSQKGELRRGTNPHNLGLHLSECRKEAVDARVLFDITIRYWVFLNLTGRDSWQQSI